MLNFYKISIIHNLNMLYVISMALSIDVCVPVLGTKAATENGKTKSTW